MQKLHEMSLYRIEQPDSYSEAMADAKKEFAEENGYDYTDLEATTFRERSAGAGPNQPPASVEVLVAPSREVVDARFEEREVQHSEESGAHAQARANAAIDRGEPVETRTLRENDDGYVVGVESDSLK